jgi:FtsX-like permease family
VDHAGVRVFLNDWITLNFILAGLVAWWRRPDTRFGVLMVAAGFVNFLATLDWATADVPYTVGVALDLLAPVLFLHACLAYPSGRLISRLDRTIVFGAYATAARPVCPREPVRRREHLVLSVFERTRELGMLRAVGMTRRQVRQMIRHESIVTLLIGATLGIAVGIFLAGLTSLTLSDYGVVFALPYRTLAIFVAGAILAGMLAAILPARRASRLNVLEALQYE